MVNIQEHLWHLGVGKRLKGYRMTILAVSLAIADEECLQCAQEHLYKPIAEKMDCDFRSVERNIRTVIEHAWQSNPDYLSRLAGFSLNHPPTVIQFLDILVTFLMREREREHA